MSSNERWAEVDRLFQAALELPDEDRTAYLAACPDQGLRAEVESLLTAHSKSLQFAVPESGDGAQLTFSPESVPSAVGAYRVVTKVAQGGMGVVYEAFDPRANKRVAIKFLSPSLVSAGFPERFDRETRILATFDHPNICRLLDHGATPSGQPYLVMDYVDGARIDEYCDANQLDIANRLRLFVKVCDAVQAAHRGLVAHLDIKPSNILVTAEGEPKLLDFGTAKVVDLAAGDPTTTQAMTPGYASPEQLRGEPVSTACDLYSLGVVLYELLTGASPFGDRKSLIAILDRATGKDPLVLSGAVTEEAATRRGLTQTRLQAVLRGDLTSIVLKAMAEEPNRRYITPLDLAADLERYLDGLPVMARPQTTLYRVAKFARRNRGSIAVTALLVVALLASAGYALWQQRKAIEEAENSRLTVTFLESVFAFANPATLGHANITVLELLDGAAKRTELSFSGAPAARSDVYRLLGSAYSGQSAPQRALASWKQAVNFARLANDPSRLAISTAGLGYSYMLLGDLSPVLPLMDQALDMIRNNSRSIRVDHHWGVLSFAGTARFYIRPADSEYVSLLEQALGVVRASPETLKSFALSQTLGTLGDAYSEKRRYAEADAILREVVAFDRVSPGHEGMITSHLMTLGRVNRNLGHPELWLKFTREGYEATLKHFGPDSLYTTNSQARVAYSLIGAGQYQEAEATASEALRVTRKLSASKFIWVQLTSAAYAKSLVGKYPEAEALARESIGALGPNPSKADTRWWESQSYLGLALEGQKKSAEALPILKETLAFAEAKAWKPPLIDHLRAAVKRLEP